MSKEYKFKESYRARIGKTPDGKYKWKRFTGCSNTSKEKAMKNAKAIAEEWMHLHQIKRTSIHTPLSAAFDEYIKAKENVLSPSTIRGYLAIRNSCLQSIMNMSIYEITQLDVQRAINFEAASKQPKTIRNIHGLLCAVLTMFRPDFVLRTTMPAKMPTKLHIPSNEEIEKLLCAAKETDHVLYIAILLAAFGSLRRSEICALTYDDITGCTVSVNKAKVPNQNSRFVVKHSTKTAAGTRIISMPQSAIDEIKNTGTAGEIVAINPDALSNRFSKLLKHAGIPHFRFHDLRHYQASILHALGVPDKYIMERGGWHTDSTLKYVYQHTMDDKRKQVEAQICDYFSERFMGGMM